VDPRGHRGTAAALPIPDGGFDSDCGSEFINHEVADWLQDRDIAQTRSRPYQKNDQAHVESKNNHVVRKHAFYWRYDTPAELELLNELWPLVSLRLNFFTPTKKPRRLHHHRGRPPQAHLRQPGHPVAAPTIIRCS
jgi:transposase InsO family protein